MLAEAIHALAYAWGQPLATGRLRQSPEDFQVIEIPLQIPDGSGEHAWLRVRKRNENTLWVAEQLARFAAVHPRQVSYAGLKDRHAVTEQWFSVQLPGQQGPDWGSFQTDSLTILEHTRHSRKLRRGALKGNHFRITLRNITGNAAALEQRLAVIAREGVPNYFGEQRFGRDGSNLHGAERLFAHPGRKIPRHKRGLMLSAVRSFLFNQVLSQRVAAGTWNKVVPGEAVQLQGTHSFFIAPEVEAELVVRMEQQDVHPTGPLHGRGESPVQGSCCELEQHVLGAHSSWCAGLEAAGLEQGRRALRLLVEGLAWQWGPAGELLLEFSLPAGAYATCVLRELVTSEVVQV